MNAEEYGRLADAAKLRAHSLRQEAINRFLDDVGSWLHSLWRRATAQREPRWG